MANVAHTTMAGLIMTMPAIKPREPRLGDCKNKATIAKAGIGKKMASKGARTSSDLIFASRYPAADGISIKPPHTSANLIDSIII